MLLAKLISSGLAGLGASGLGLYFVPKYAEGGGRESEILFQEEHSSDNKKLEILKNNRAKTLQSLQELNSKFFTVITELKKQRGEKQQTMNENFEKITKEEENLKEEYEKSKQWLDQIGQMSRGIFGANKRKLELDAIISELDYLNESLAKMYGNFRDWGFALEQFICAIDNQNQQKKCDKDELKDWLTIDHSSSATAMEQPSGGGHWGIKRSTEAIRRIEERITGKTRKN